MKKFILIFLALFSLILCACNNKENSSEFDLDYFNSHISALKYDIYEINKTIKQNDLLLLEETTTVRKNVDVYDIVKTTRKLAKIDSETRYETKVEESKMKTIEDPIILRFPQACFSSYSVNEFTLKGNIVEEYSKEVLGIEDVEDISIEINLNNDKKVSDVKIEYIDVETNFSIEILVKYEY